MEKPDVITIKRGKSHTWNFKYTPAVAAGQTAYSKNFYTSDNQFTGVLALREKLNDGYTGQQLISLTTTSSTGNQNSQGNIRFPNIGATSNLHNIQIYLSGAESTTLPNEHLLCAGDLMITDTDVAATECVHSWRLEFKIEPEIV